MKTWFNTVLLLVCFLTSLIGCKNTNHSLKKHGNKLAVWSESIYLRGFNPSTHLPVNDEIITVYCNLLKRNGVTDIFLFAGPFQKDGNLPTYPFSDTALHTVAMIKRLLPNLRILPWIGGIQNKTVFLNDSAWVNNAISSVGKLISKLHVPGVHIDFEYILKSDPYLYSELQPALGGDEEKYGINVNKFHEKLRSKLPNAFISSVVTATSKDTKPWKRKTTLHELNGLLKNIDQLCFLYYDTNIKDKDLFQTNCEQLVTDIAALKQEHPKANYYIAIGTFVNEPRLQHYRDLSIETIPSSISAINKSLEKVASKQTVIVDGLAIFCDWETDSSEWEQIHSYWFAD